MIEASGLSSEETKKKAEEFSARYRETLDQQRRNILREKYGISLLKLMILKVSRKSQSEISHTR
ncbi:MAG: hypothetical protein NC483_00320 [Ruminococcus sp.]|nr:hypothetical protein [Ruminococcus sp.]